MAYPNEELPAGRPLTTTPCYDELAAAGARFTVNWGLEVPLYFAPSPGFEENDTLGRSNAEPIVGEEVAAVRSAAGAYEIAQYARYEVLGPGAEAWLDHLLAARIPGLGEIRLAPMLNDAGRLMGDLTVARLGDDRFWLTGSYYLQDWHLRWFRAHLPSSGVTVTNVTDGWMGFSLSGPASREDPCRARDTTTCRTTPFGFLRIREMDVGYVTGGRRADLADGRARVRDHRCRAPAPDAAAGAPRGRRRDRPAPDRGPRDRQPSPGEGLRHLVGRVPAGLHAGDGRSRPVRRVRQGRLHRRRRGAERPRRRPRPAPRAARGRRDRCRCLRRRGHLDRRPPRRLRHLRRLRPPRRREPRARLRRS